MYSRSVDEKCYKDCMSGLSVLSHQLRKTLESNEYRSGIKRKKLKALMHKGPIVFVYETFKKIYNKLMLRKLNRMIIPFKREAENITEPDYFSSERIAVYTCVFGKYDDINEPLCHPNNIDYFIITDSTIDSNSSWKKIDIKKYKKKIDGLSDVEKNRWFKIHASEVFGEYKYSIYIDGNVIPVTDFTAFVNRMGDCGIAMFWHSYNNCVYQEALFNKYSVRKISNKELDKHVEYLKSKGMPANFGMTTCNVIVRQHDNPICIKIMEDWWEEFVNHCKRDQMSFPYVVWKNGIKMSDIARLGNNVWESDALLVISHIN